MENENTAPGQPSPYSDNAATPPAAEPSFVSDAQKDIDTVVEKIDWEAKYLAEVAAHEATKIAMRAYEALVAKAKAMGFTGGAGVHGGA